ncbi:UbiX family flavin prenyltransferase [Helicobacter cetorum]|uniref:Flavin prenyltransferase UbiX n=1 Tax=Helicobacter cetorum (strain ATCC BAA-429 / MIT 00-7128) TaxID=182217 RepID=I0EKY1_HELC0|nr:UbiX family flavin prenyltransferase [Helicobacter cetorum]AFI03600.1 3-octaprenyl-4-hydroxybenzoate carboxy-lyase [Helicobacter cetorum MIT 00-7128]
MKLVLGISGASGIPLALRFIRKLPKDIELFVVVSKNSLVVAKEEMQINLKSVIKKERSSITLFDEQDIHASISSGSYGVHKMAIIPASMDMVAKIAHGFGGDLISRCASVMLKEKRPLLIAPREMPLSDIMLENLLKLSRSNAIISPPMMTYYTQSKDLDSMEDFLVGKWFDSLGIENDLYPRWGVLS